MGQVKQSKSKMLLEEVERFLAVDQPELTAKIQGEDVYVTGTYYVQPRETINLAHGCLDKFEIEIIIRRGFPKVEPVVRELGGKIPRTSDRHINEDEGTCCIEVWETWLVEHPDANISDFFDIPVRNFFLGQVPTEESERFPFGEHAHYELGRLAAYANLLGCEHKKQKIVRILEALRYSPPRGHWDCPCGSGKRIRNCCRRPLLEKSQSIPPSLAESLLKKLK